MYFNWRLLLCLGVLLVVHGNCKAQGISQESKDVEDVGNDEAATTVAPPPAGVKEFIQGLLEKILDGSDSEAASEQILGSGISALCGLRILKFVNALRNLEPWVVRMIDATGKYPTGLFQGSIADPGAFDECIETVVVDSRGREKVRAHYCNLFLKAGNASEIPDFIQDALLMTHRRIVPAFEKQADERTQGILLGICVPTECKEDDIEKLIRTLSRGGVNPDVRNCVTNQYPAPDATRIGIIAALSVLVLVMLTSTTVDIVMVRRHGKTAHRGTLLRCITGFSVASNTRMLLGVGNKGSEAHTLRFLHGIRFLSMMWIVFGHAYSSGSSIAGRLANVFVYSDRALYVIIFGAYLSVDTFLFLGGFLLTYNTLKHRKTNKLVSWITGVCRFYIRINAPVFFMIMCLYLLPLIITGPRAQELYSQMFSDVRENWWTLLLNVRNVVNDVDVTALGHLWYLSVAFQAFLVKCQQHIWLSSM
ncbi:nose resistant to fluoxetine protein 6-like [Ornithodoros turicata]|uniref:nose resistant to fluoxetine protein 6-like n=1 Tax=Ornithodoros turicata TaxID=34597 RepID=UPI003139C576